MADAGSAASTRSKPSLVRKPSLKAGAMAERARSLLSAKALAAVDSGKSVHKCWATTELWPDVKVGDVVYKKGYAIEWSPMHKVGGELEPLRQRGDVLADRVLDEMDIKKGEDYWEVLQQHAGQSSSVDALLASLDAEPAWLDRAALRRGQLVYARFAFGVNIALLYYSLAGGFGAPRINKVLLSTGYLSGADTVRRLGETSQMILDCMHEGSMEPRKGRGWLSTVRVRFLHAHVRRQLLRSGRWDAVKHGVPINQEDMVATLLSFQYVVIATLEALGFNLSKQEQEDYTHLWRYIAYVIGVDDDVNPCSSIAACKASLESILCHLYDPDTTSQYLSQHVLKSVADGRLTAVSYSANAEMARYVMGDLLADELGLPQSQTHIRVAIDLFFVFLRFLSQLLLVPVVGPVLMWLQLAYLENAVLKFSGGKRTVFALTHDADPDGVAEKTHWQHRWPPVLALFGCVVALAVLALGVIMSR